MVMTMPGETQQLLDSIDMARVGSIVDPWSGMGTIAMMFKATGLHVHTNDANRYSPAAECMDALLPATYEHWQHDFRLDAIVTSPHFAFLDLALPLAAEMVQTVACIHCPSHFYFDATHQRLAYFQLLAAHGRLHVITHLPHGPTGRRCVWICVFRTATDKARLLLTPDNVTAVWALQQQHGPTL
jgi:hypothetical protein